MGKPTEIYLFECEGCRYHHAFYVRDHKPSWSFNGDMEKPTFSPSLFYRSLDHKEVCHIFLRDGQVEYLDDCAHDMAGKTSPVKGFHKVSEE